MGKKRAQHMSNMVTFLNSEHHTHENRIVRTSDSLFWRLFLTWFFCFVVVMPFLTEFIHMYYVTYIYACCGTSTDSVKLIRDKQNVSFLKLWHSTNLKNLLNRLHTIYRRLNRNKSHYQILSFFLYQTIAPMRKSRNIQTWRIFSTA